MVKSNVPFGAIVFWVAVILMILICLVLLHLHAMQVKKAADKGHEKLKDSFKIKL